MCYGDEAHPPLTPSWGGADDHGEIVISSSNGTDLAGYYAHPRYPARSSIVILPDARGLPNFYKELAVRFANLGFHALAIDYHHSAAVAESRTDLLVQEPIGRFDPASVDADTAAAVAWLRGLPDGGNCPVFSIGFCLGGTMSWRQSAAGHGLRGCIGFCGSPSDAEDQVEQMASPLLMLVAGEDHTPVEQVEEFAERVRRAGVSADVHIYSHAPHRFFDLSLDQFEAECDDAWYRILAFTERYA